MSNNNPNSFYVDAGRCACGKRYDEHDAPHETAEGPPVEVSTIEIKTVSVQTKDLRAELIQSLLDAGYLESQIPHYMKWAQEDLTARMFGGTPPPKPVPRGVKKRRALNGSTF